MATKVKPTRLNVTGVPQVGKVPTYVDKNTFAWGNGGGGGGYGRFLSLWDCSTGMPISFPEATPYTYLTGDYFLVEVVDSSDPATNYKPDGATYTGAASTTVESDSVAKGDVYVYDGTVWLLQSNSDKSVSFSNITGQPTDNINLAADLNAKQDNLTAGNGINIDVSNKISTTYIYGESSTAAATVQKEVSIPSITELNVGQVIIVKPTVTSTVASSTLKLNNFDAYKMLYNGAEITTSTDSIVWAANIPSMFYLDEVSGTKYWRFLGHGLDSNTTYTINYLYDAGKYKAGTGTYAITRYSLCMMKADGTWEKITATNAILPAGTTKTVNTNGFVLNQIKYYNTTTTVANGAFVGTNTFSSQAASVRADYSFNCGTAPGWSVGDTIYIVGTMGVDGLFYLDTTARWSTTLPSTNDGKLYIRIGTALTTTDATISFLADRPIFYYNNGIKEYTTGKIDELETGLATKQDELVSGVNIRTINGTSILGNGDIATPTGIPSQTGEAGKYLTTDGTSVSWGTVSAGVTSVNGNTGAVTVNDVKVAATAPASPTEGTTWYDTTNDQLKVYDGSNWQVTGKEYEAGQGIEIGTLHSDMQGPCPDGFHIPLNTEWQKIKDIWVSLGQGEYSGSSLSAALNLPLAGCIRENSGALQKYMFETYGRYYTAIAKNNGTSYIVDIRSNLISTTGDEPKYYATPIRPFKDTPVIPTSSWTTVYAGTGDAGIFHSATNGLISLSSDGVNWITIADKNVGATTVWENGDTLNAANCGNYYQRGNNYGFSFDISGITTSNTKVNASNYGPGNYYSSSTFIIVSSSPWDRSSVTNNNLWGGTSQGTWFTSGNSIINTGVLSVNGQTGNVTVAGGIQNDTTGTTTTVSAIRAGTEAEYNALQTYSADIIYHIY